MKLLFKQRFFSWFDSYDIYDEYGNTVYTVKGQLSWGHCLHIYNPQNGHIGTVQEKVLTMLPKFELYMGDRYIGQVKKEFSFFIPKYTLDCMGWKVEGDIMGWDYRITDAYGNAVASVEKKIWNWTDTYELSFADGGIALYILMIVLAIDAANCSND